MNKNQLLQELKQKLDAEELTRQQIIEYLGVESRYQTSAAQKSVKKSRISILGIQLYVGNILYIFGGLVVITGILILTDTIWPDIGSVGRVIITLGLGLVFVGVGIWFKKEYPENTIGKLFHFFGGILVPVGALVALYELIPNIDSMWWPTIVFGIISAMYILLTLSQRQQILTFFAFANVTVFTYLLVTALMIDGGLLGSYFRNVYAYLTMVVGLSYLLFGWVFHATWNKHVAKILYFLGSFGFLAAGFERLFQGTVWEFLFVFFVGAIVYLSTRFENRPMLFVGSLFLFAYIIYLTAEYFADSVSWPLLLIFLGFVLIAIGFASVQINKKYIDKDKQITN